MDVLLVFSASATFARSKRGNESCRGHNMSARSWRHLVFCRYQAHLHADVPRFVALSFGVRQAKLDWALAQE